MRLGGGLGGQALDQALVTCRLNAAQSVVPGGLRAHTREIVSLSPSSGSCRKLSRHSTSPPHRSPGGLPSVRGPRDNAEETKRTTAAMMLSRTAGDRDPLVDRRRDRKEPAGTMGLCGRCALSGDRISSTLHCWSMHACSTMYSHKGVLNVCAQSFFCIHMVVTHVGTHHRSLCVHSALPSLCLHVHSPHPTPLPYLVGLLHVFFCFLWGFCRGGGGANPCPPTKNTQNNASSLLTQLTSGYFYGIFQTWSKHGYCRDYGQAPCPNAKSPP